MLTINCIDKKIEYIFFSLNGFTKIINIKIKNEIEQSMKNILKEALKTSLLLIFLSNENLSNASVMFKVIMGIIKEIVVVIRSSIPYSSVDRVLVYNGISKNVIALGITLLIKNKKIFFNKFLYFFMIITFLF